MVRAVLFDLGLQIHLLVGYLDFCVIALTMISFFQIYYLWLFLSTIANLNENHKQMLQPTVNNQNSITSLASLYSFPIFIFLYWMQFQSHNQMFLRTPDQRFYGKRRMIPSLAWALWRIMSVGILIVLWRNICY